MSRFRFSPAPAYDASMGSALKQEAFMNWGQIDLSWIQLRDKIVFQWRRLTARAGNSGDSIGAEMWRDSQSGDAQKATFSPDNDAKRDEFSLHIGC